MKTIKLLAVNVIELPVCQIDATDDRSHVTVHIYNWYFMYKFWVNLTHVVFTILLLTYFLTFWSITWVHTLDIKAFLITVPLSYVYT